MLRPGGRIVILDGKRPAGALGRIALPFCLWLMKRTLLANPFIEPWKHLGAIAEQFQMEERLFGSWYVCWGTKSARSDVSRSRMRGAARRRVSKETVQRT